MQQIYVPKQDYKVLVRCFTYNQSKYIEDALNGFAMQKTNFPFVCLVMDDCSTDGEQEAIKVWMNDNCDMSGVETIDVPTSVVLIVPHKKNANCNFAFYLLKQNLYNEKENKMAHVKPWREHCVYEALCEGDDYWTDPLKLQKQVDWLENHPDYGMVYTDFDILRNGVIYKSSGVNRSDGDIFYTLLVEDNFIATLTTCYRKSLLSQIDTDYPSSFKMGDLPLWIQIARISKIKYLNESTSVYRRLDDSASHSVDFNRQMSFARNALEVQRYYAEKFNVLQALPIIDANIAKNKVVLALYNLDIYGFCNLIRGVCIDLSDIMKVLKAWRDKFAMLL